MTHDLRAGWAGHRTDVPVAAVQGTLALDLRGPRREPPAFPVVPSGPVVPLDPERRRTEAWCRRFTQAVAEIVAGDRPVTQVLRWTSRRVFDDLERRALLVSRAAARQPWERAGLPVRPRVASVHAQSPRPGIVEAAVRLEYGRRSRALAVRFEQQPDGRLLCTALDFA